MEKARAVWEILQKALQSKSGFKNWITSAHFIVLLVLWQVKRERGNKRKVFIDGE